MKDDDFGARWLEVFNSILRLKFYAYLETKNSHLLEELDNEFTEFARKSVNAKENNLRFFGGNTLMGFSYLVLVRMFETLKSKFDHKYIDQLFLTSDWGNLGINNFSDLKSKYNMQINTFAEKKSNGKRYYDTDTEKIRFLMNKIRNSVSHYRYDHPDDRTIRLKDINSGGIVELDMSMSYASFLNFCADVGCLVNDTIIRDYV